MLVGWLLACRHSCNKQGTASTNKETELAFEPGLSRMHQERLPAHLVARVRMHACIGRRDERRASDEASNSNRHRSQGGCQRDEGARNGTHHGQGRRGARQQCVEEWRSETIAQESSNNRGSSTRGFSTPALQLSDVAQIGCGSNGACQCPALHLAHSRSHGRLCVWVCVAAGVWPQVCQSSDIQQQRVCAHRYPSLCAPVCCQGNGCAPSAHA